jgi:hypothetical protein
VRKEEEEECGEEDMEGRHIGIKNIMLKRDKRFV